MVYNYLFIFFFIIFFVVLLSIFIIYNKETDKFSDKFSDKIVEISEISEKGDKGEKGELKNLTKNCVCCFDLDKTLTCSIKQGRDAINTCRKNNCILAINTARFGPYFDDVPLNELGLSLNEIKNDIYHGSGPNVLSTITNAQDFNDHIARKKLDHLYTIKHKYDIDPKKIILFDDNENNIKFAKNSGFSIIYANNPMCGLNNNVSRQIDSILN